MITEFVEYSGNINTEEIRFLVEFQHHAKYYHRIHFYGNELDAMRFDSMLQSFNFKDVATYLTDEQYYQWCGAMMRIQHIMESKT